MPISLSAKKSLRKSLKNRKENVYAKSKLKKIVKDFLTKPSAEGLKAVYSALDKVGKKRIYHGNKVARLKSEFAGKVKVKKQDTKATTKKSSKKMS